MRPSEVRQKVLADHEDLRARLDEIEDLVRAFEEGDGTRVRSLRMRGLELLEALERHMQWEDERLIPALRESYGPGAERAERLDADHREQREVLRHALRTLADRARPPSLLARGLRDFAFLLRADMEEEENLYLVAVGVWDDEINAELDTA